MKKMKCPNCTISDEVYNISVHLVERHGYSYVEAMDWLRDQKENT